MNVIRVPGDEWIENGFYAYHFGCEKKGCGAEGRVLMAAPIAKPYYKHKRDWSPGCGIPLELTHSVAWKWEHPDLSQTIFMKHPNQ